MPLRRPLALAVVLTTCFAAGGLLAACAASSKGDATVATASQGSAAARTTASKQPIEVVTAQFGVFGADPPGRRVLFETDTFPAIAAAPYGWYIIFKTDRPTVVWREEFELPEAPPTWGPGEAMGIYTISPDRKTAVTERIVPTRLGFIANEWRYAPGDPIGAHAMRVYIDGQLIKDFRFKIEDGPGTEERDPHGGTRRGGRGPTT
jgi:hypothetical protein